jgi:hypothetical protein
VTLSLPITKSMRSTPTSTRTRPRSTRPGLESTRQGENVNPPAPIRSRADSQHTRAASEHEDDATNPISRHVSPQLTVDILHWLKADDATFDNFTKFAGKGALGLEYVLPDNNLGLFVQATSYIYQFDRGGFDKTQADLLWTGGLSYRFSY